MLRTVPSGEENATVEWSSLRRGIVSREEEEKSVTKLSHYPHPSGEPILAQTVVECVAEELDCTAT